MRRAYLGLLKLCLCDLAGAGTTAVEGLPHGVVASHELGLDELELRAEGRDWPLHALTMTGLARLDDLQACVEAVISDGIAGDLIETGSWRGGSSILMRATLDALGADDRTVWVADSFNGFPVFRPGAPLAYEQTMGPWFSPFDYLAVPLEEVRGYFARFGLETGVRFVPGFFEETLPGLTGERWSLVRLDGDTYDATLLGLRCLYPGLAVGGYLIIDDYGALDECAAAVDQFRSEHGLGEPIEAIDWTGARWRKEREVAIPAPSPAAGGAAPPIGAARPADRRVPSLAELELHERIAGLEAELREHQRQLDELRRRSG